MIERRIATLFTALFLAISPLFSQEAEEPSVLAPALVTPAPDTSAYIRFIRDTSATALTPIIFLSFNLKPLLP